MPPLWHRGGTKTRVKSCVRGFACFRFPNKAQEQYLTFLRGEAKAAFAELDQDEPVRTTPDELMDSIEQELGIAPR